MRGFGGKNDGTEIPTGSELSSAFATFSLGLPRLAQPRQRDYRAQSSVLRRRLQIRLLLRGQRREDTGIKSQDLLTGHTEQVYYSETPT